jgi:hypothetical protein
MSSSKVIGVVSVFAGDIYGYEANLVATGRLARVRVREGMYVCLSTMSTRTGS